MGAASALLAGCGGSQPPIGAPEATSQDHAFSKASSDALLYIANSCDQVCIVSYPGGSEVGQLGSTGGICPEPNGNVYQPTWNSSGYAGVDEYAHGGTQPLRSIALDRNMPISCAVDKKNGDLAVAMIFGQIAVVPSGSKSPVFYNVQFNPKSVTYDDLGNLFVDGYKGTKTTVLAELIHGNSSFVELDFKKQFRDISQLQWDGKYLAIEDAVKPIVYRLSVQKTKVSLVGSVQFSHVGNLAGTFWIEGSTIILPYAWRRKDPSIIALFPYPQGGKGKVIFSKLRALYGVAVSAAPSH
jgi:hypothetical protein